MAGLIPEMFSSKARLSLPSGHIDIIGNFDDTYSTPLSIDNTENERYGLASDIMILLFGSKSIAMSIALATTPKTTRRYGKQPGPGWIPAGVSRNGQQIWLWSPHTATPHTPVPPPPTPNTAAQTPPPPVPPAPTTTLSVAPKKDEGEK